MTTRTAFLVLTPLTAAVLIGPVVDIVAPMSLTAAMGALTTAIALATLSIILWAR